MITNLIKERRHRLAALRRGSGSGSSSAVSGTADSGIAGGGSFLFGGTAGNSNSSISHDASGGGSCGGGRGGGSGSRGSSLLCPMVKLLLLLAAFAAVPPSLLSHKQVVVVHQQHLKSVGTAAAAANSTLTTAASARPSLLPEAMEYRRRGVPLLPIYREKFGDPLRDANLGAGRAYAGRCSCLNSESRERCCERNFRRCHKMGVTMTRAVFNRRYNPEVYLWSRDPTEMDYWKKGVPRRRDFRDVLLLRNLKDALVSGYLYHRDGRECHKDGRGRPWNNDGSKWQSVAQWEDAIAYEPDPPANGRSLCRYLEGESTEAGMRAYVEYILHSQYVTMFNHLALSKEVPEIAERTLVLCYDDLVDPDRADDTMNAALAFWYNSTTPSTSAAKDSTSNASQLPYKPWTKGPPGGRRIGKEHASDSDVELRLKLRQVVDDLDAKFYGGDLAWLGDTQFPC